MKIKSTKFKDLKVILSPVHKDNRGYFKEVEKLVGAPPSNKFKKIKHSVNLSYSMLKMFPKKFL